MALPNPDGVPVQIDGLTAIVTPFISLENIAPLSPSCDDDLDKLFPWVFTQQDVATEDGVYCRLEEGEEYRFCKLFEALIDIPRQPRGFCEYMGRMNEKFSSQPDGYWKQQKCLHLLVSEVGGFMRKSLSLDRNHFKLQYCQELITVKSDVLLTFERYDELSITSAILGAWEAV
ncbi:MAG: hypothetical protein M1839_005901 [Geoglossum umbratile]|nr:MAG: hypothetical protein M1839_005901 [Geoglossum umbratile]